jgi:hypothetical protein
LLLTGVDDEDATERNIGVNELVTFFSFAPGVYKGLAGFKTNLG